MTIDLNHPAANRLLNAIDARDVDTVVALSPQLTLEDGLLATMWHYVLCDELSRGGIPGPLHQIVRNLVVNLGVDINQHGFSHKSILFYYVYYKDFALADELLALGADVNGRILTGNRDDNDSLLAEPLICEFIQRMNPERDFPEDFSEQVNWLRARGADEHAPPEPLPEGRVQP